MQKLIQKVFTNYKCRIYRLRPPLVSVTNMDTSRRVFHSPQCGGETEVYRGYRHLRPVKNYNIGKKEEYLCGRNLNLG